MSTATARVPAPAGSRRAAAIPVVLAFFSGPVGLVTKIGLLSLSNGLAVWAAYVLVDHRNWVALAVLAAATGLIDYVYLARRRTPAAKFLVPATVFLIGFQVVPIIYTVEVAFTNYSTGHIASKADAIRQIERVTLEPPANGKSYTAAPARDAGGNLVLVLRDDQTGKDYVGTDERLTALAPGTVTTGALGIASAKGYRLLKGNELFSLDKTLNSFVVPTAGGAGIRMQGLSQAVELRPTLRYDSRRDAFVRTRDGTVFHDNGEGSFVSATGEELEPGWKTFVGTKNFGSIIHNSAIRKPFLQIFWWTFVFAVSVVFLSFAVGLFLAIVLNKKGMRFRRLYRSAILIPWAVPGFLSLLVWQGLLNDDFGVVNRVFLNHVGLNVPWLFDGDWAKVSVILVSFWLTVPYFFLVSLGALQSIPDELVEAARVDGGGPIQIFRRVTLPLLLVAVSPLLIASFAFNFNNFNNIYLLTSGCPCDSAGGIAGSTDILISYTYKLAIATGKGQDFALASAVSIIVFLIVASISAVSFSRTKALENLA
ncbi:MAG TPA: ABC transporter permease subunit [Gaiellaceae bacterium]|nr:ABC transporter permease subunit [Gaiellaceae bacterium]